MTRRTVRRPRLYFSFRSPYSWLTVRRLLEELPEAATEFDWLPYWDPDPLTSAALDERGARVHYVQMSRAKHLYLLLDTKRLANELGVPMAWPVDVDCWWELPHLAYLAARRAGRSLEFYQALTAARWGRGEDICVTDVVRRAAIEAGVAADLAVSAPDDPAIRAEGVDCMQLADDDDVFGIPYLRWGRHRFWGYERLDPFLKLWRADHPVAATATASSDDDERAPHDLAAVLRANGVGYDRDTPGGCG